MKSNFMNNTLEKLQTIPGIGPKLSKEFSDIGITSVSDLKGKNPEKIYSKICVKQGIQVDRCVLYICRSSIYFSENKNLDSEKLKWWNWKD